MMKQNKQYFDFVSGSTGNNVLWLNGSGKEGKSSLIGAADIALPGKMQHIPCDWFITNKTEEILSKVISNDDNIEFFVISEPDNTNETLFDNIDKCAKIFINHKFIIVSNFEIPSKMNWSSFKMEKYFDKADPYLDLHKLSRDVSKILSYY